MSKFFSKIIYKKVLFIIFALLIVIFLPVGLYARWFLSVHKFKSFVEKQINSLVSFSYDSYEIHGFWSQDLKLKFVNPVFYIGDEKNRFIIKFDDLFFSWKPLENDIYIENHYNKFRIKFKGERFSCSGIKVGKIVIDQTKKEYFKFLLNQQNINCRGEDLNEEKIGDIDLNIESVLENDHKKILSILANIIKDQIKAIDYDCSFSWNKTDINPRYSANLKKVKINKDGRYKIDISGSPVISVTYKYNIDGNICLKIENYEEFFTDLQSTRIKDNAENIDRIIEFLLLYSKIDGNFLIADFAGKDGEVFLGDQSVDDVLINTLS